MGHFPAIPSAPGRTAATDTGTSKAVSGKASGRNVKCHHSSGRFTNPCAPSTRLSSSRFSRAAADVPGASVCEAGPKKSKAVPMSASRRAGSATSVTSTVLPRLWDDFAAMYPSGISRDLSTSG